LNEVIPAFCKSVNIEEVKVLNCVVTPGRFVGLVDYGNNFNFEERFLSLKAEQELKLM